MSTATRDATHHTAVQYPYPDNTAITEKQKSVTSPDGQRYPYGRPSDPQYVARLTSGTEAVVTCETLLDYCPLIDLSAYDARNSQWPSEPWSQDWYLDACTLMKGTDEQDAEVVKVQPTVDDLALYAHGEEGKRTDYYLYVNGPLGTGSDAASGCGFQLVDGTRYARARLVTFVKAYDPGDGYFDIVYAGFWAINNVQWVAASLVYDDHAGDRSVDTLRATIDDAAFHMGDWEHVTVRVALEDDGPGRVLGVFYSAHGAGRWWNAIDIPFAGTHPIVYNKANSHAFAPEAGDVATSEKLSIDKLLDDSDLPDDVRKALESVLESLDSKLTLQLTESSGWGIDKGDDVQEAGRPGRHRWAAYDPQQAGAGLVDITAHMIGDSVAETTSGCRCCPPDPDLNMNWVLFDGRYGQPERQNYIREIATLLGASPRTRALIAAVNQVLKQLEIPADKSGGAWGPWQKEWGFQDEFWHWNPASHNLVYGEAFGGDDGNPFDDGPQIPTCPSVTRVGIRTADRVFEVALALRDLCPAGDDPGGEVVLVHGSDEGTPQELELGEDEEISQILVSVAETEGRAWLSSIRIETDQGRYIEGGEVTGNLHAIDGPAGWSLVGFFGRSSTGLDQLGGIFL